MEYENTGEVIPMPDNGEELQTYTAAARDINFPGDIPGRRLILFSRPAAGLDAGFP